MEIFLILMFDVIFVFYGTGYSEYFVSQSEYTSHIGDISKDLTLLRNFIHFYLDI